MKAEILDQQVLKEALLLTPREAEKRNKTLLINKLLILPKKK